MKYLVKIFKSEYLWLVLILVLAFSLRLYKIDRPLADWHSWRQADTAAVSRNFIKEGNFDVLHPKFDDLSNIPSGLSNPEGYRFVEFPIYNVIVSLVYLPIGVFEILGRLVSVLFSIGAIALLFLLVRKFAGSRIALLSAFFMATIPYSVFYSTVFLPEPMMLFLQIGAIFFFAKWVDNDKKIGWFLLSASFFSLAILTKPMSLFVGFPILYLALQKYSILSIKKIPLYVFLIIALAPFIAWRIWAMQFPEGIPAWDWLLNKDGIRFKGAFFHWIIAERIGKLILAYGGFVLFVIGILLKPIKREGIIFHSWLFGIVLYFVIFASGNVTHDYYQIPFIPIAAIFVAKGFDFLFFIPKERFVKFLGPVMAVFLILALWGFGWFEVRGFYWINRPEIIEAGIVANFFLPRCAKVIAPYGGDTAFLYQTKRKGWPHVTDTMENLKAQGATHYVSVDFDDRTKELMEKYKVIIKTDKFVIIDLAK